MIILGTNSIKDTGFDVANSARWNRADSAYMDRTFSSSGNRDKWTYSLWVKKCKNGVEQRLLTTSDNSSFDDNIRFESDDKIMIICNNTETLKTNRVFRDPSAWYHICVIWDSGNGTSGDRCQLWINGIRETSFGTESYPSQNQDSFINNNTRHYIGVTNVTANSHFLDGYLSEVVFQNDSADSPVDKFGSFDEDSGIFKPIDVSDLTFGTNGFYLDFEDSSALGNDVSGNNNDFSLTNFAATDQSTDTCTNNFAVGNPLLNYNPNLSEGNLVLASTGTAWKNSMSTIGVSSGIWYHEVKITAESGVPYQLIGVTDSYHPNSWGASPPNYLGIGALQIGYYNDNGTYYQSDGQQSYSGNGFGVNDTIGVLLDLDAGTPTIKFYKNDADQGSINLPTSSNSTGLWFFMQSMYISTCSVNYGSPAHAITSGNQDGNGYGNFEFATKGGYTLNTKNLAEYG